MPTYDYRCTACEHTFELFQSMKDAVKRKCPACGKNALERLIGTGAAVIFKGSGFYQTDYRSKSYNEAAKKDNSAASSAEQGSSGGGTSSDKSADKAPAKPDTASKPAEGPKATDTAKPAKPAKSAKSAKPARD